MPANEQLQDLHFPKGGVELSKAAMSQPWRPGPPRPGGEPTRIYTCADAENVRTFDPLTDRMRGGSRACLGRWCQNPVIAGWLIQHLNTVTGAEAVPLQGSQSGRVVTGVAVCQGRVFWFEPADDPTLRVITEATNSSSTTPPLNFSGLVRSAPNHQKLWLVDGTHYRRFTPITNIVDDWPLTAGIAHPRDSSSNGARLIALWRGRIVLSGLLLDGANWFMSASDAPGDFDYSPVSQSPTQAVAGNNSRLGKIGDQITALMAWNDDELIFGEDGSIWIMRGDPMTGGELDMVTDQIGVAFGEAFTRDPKGNIFFMSNTGSIYVMTPHSQPERLSVPIDQRLKDIDTGAKSVRLEWDETQKGLHVFMTSLDAATVDDRHLFWEATNNAWQPDRFANKKHNPLASCVIDGNSPTDRKVLIGSWDGYIRCYDPTATKDDGTVMTSYVVLGPFLTKSFDEVTLLNLQAVLAESSGKVTWTIHVGRTAEAALAAPALPVTGTWKAGRNYTESIRRSGHAIFVKISSTEQWALEGIRAAFSPNLSKIRRRGA